MISFLQNILQKHHKWLFSILLFVIVVAFVFTIGASPGIGRSKVKHNYFYGKDLSNMQQMNEVAENVMYSSVIRGIDSNYVRANLNSFIVRRIAALGLANEFNIPLPSEEALKKYIKTLPVFLGEDGKFSNDLYTSILEMFSAANGGHRRFKQVLCENYQIDQIERVISGTGFITDKQVAMFLSLQNMKYDFTIASISKDASCGNIEVTDDEISEFYKKNPGRYMQPQMHAVSMIKFDNQYFEQFVKEPSDDELREFFAENETSFSANAKFDDIKQAIHDAYVKAESTRLAYASAEDFVTELYSDNIELNSKKFEEALDKYNVKKEKIAAYSKKKLPSANGISATYLLAACDLDSDKYYTDPCPAAFGCAVLLLEWKKDARELTFDEAISAIREDIAREKTLECFAAKIEQIRKDIIVAMVSQEKVKDVFASHGLKSDSYVGVSIKNFDEKKIYPICKDALLSLKKNEEIKFLPMSEDEVLMFVVTRRDDSDCTSIDEEEVSAVENQFKQFNKEFILLDFFNNQAGKLFK